MQLNIIRVSEEIMNAIKYTIIVHDNLFRVCVCVRFTFK